MKFYHLYQYTCKMSHMKLSNLCDNQNIIENTSTLEVLKFYKETKHK